MPRFVKAEFVDLIDIPGTEHTLAVWRNPETGQLFAVDNMEIDASRNHANDPYVDGVALVFEDTFSGLPK